MQYEYIIFYNTLLSYWNNLIGKMCEQLNCNAIWVYNVLQYNIILLCYQNTLDKKNEYVIHITIWIVMYFALRIHKMWLNIFILLLE